MWIRADEDEAYAVAEEDLCMQGLIGGHSKALFNAYYLF